MQEKSARWKIATKYGENAIQLPVMKVKIKL
jgi:hypothetical protein